MFTSGFLKKFISCEVWGGSCYFFLLLLLLLFCFWTKISSTALKKYFFRTWVWTYSFTPCNASITSSSTHLLQEKKRLKACIWKLPQLKHHMNNLQVKLQKPENTEKLSTRKLSKHEFWAHFAASLSPWSPLLMWADNHRRKAQEPRIKTISRE